MFIDAEKLDYRSLNEAIRTAGDTCHITGCLGQRFIAAGMSGKKIEIDGIPGNALGAYLGGCEITIHGNAQDAVGDTMNDGTIVVSGSIGDAAGYAMRGGAIYIKGNAGYRAGIHMKEYKEKKPVIVIGGRAGSFLGEYQAGGVIVVLGLHTDSRPIVGNFPATGMHGGKIFVRGTFPKENISQNIKVQALDDDDKKELDEYIKKYCKYFNKDYNEIMQKPFKKLVAATSRPYANLYTPN